MRPFLSCVLLACACATPRVEKMSFEELYSAAPAPPPPLRRPEVPAHALPAGVPIDAALLQFAERARIHRNATAQGGAMPQAQVESWRDVLATLDAHFARGARQTSSHDIVRARVTLEAELEMDARRYGDMPAELAEQVLERVTHLAVRMAEVRRSNERPRPKPLAWPVEPVVVTSVFGQRLHPVSRSWQHHSGVDLRAEPGQLVSAAGPGTVVFAGWNGAHGKHVEIHHGGGVVTRYSHLAQLLVERGVVVGKGDPIGLAGATGKATGVHLHFELIRDGRPCDPLDELDIPGAGARKRPVSARSHTHGLVR